MFDTYFSNLENSLKKLFNERKSDRDEISKIQFDLSILRRDLNDIHSIIMLRDIAQKIKKEDCIAFIGIGGLGENSIHAFIYCKMMQQQGKINADTEIIFVAQNQVEYNFLSSYGFDGVYLWQYQTTLAKKLLQAKTVVASTHLFSEWGRCLLSACFSSANMIQLWHGLPAKVIGMAGLAETGDFHFFARMLNDVVNTDYVFIENDLDNTKQVYQDAYPNCKLVGTGSVRLHILFDEQYRQLFLEKKQNHSLLQWLDRSDERYTVLYCPTYREQASLATGFLKNIKDVLSKGYDKFRVAVKLHIGTILNENQTNELIELAHKNGNLYIDRTEEIYSVFPNFDAIVTDYSSIRMDFAVLGKPVFLYQFDKDAYSRKTDIIELFSELDKVSYYLNDFVELGDILDNDDKKIERENLVNNRLRRLLYDDSANRVMNAILKIHNQE